MKSWGAWRVHREPDRPLLVRAVIFLYVLVIFGLEIAAVVSLFTLQLVPAICFFLMTLVLRSFIFDPHSD